MVEALTQHNGHAKSQSTVIFCKGAMRVFAATTPSLILCPHPLKPPTCKNMKTFRNSRIKLFVICYTIFSDLDLLQLNLTKLKDTSMNTNYLCVFFPYEVFWGGFSL